MKKLILFLTFAATMAAGCTTKVIYMPFLAPAADSAGRDLFQFYGYEDSLGRWHEWGYPVWKRTLATPHDSAPTNAGEDTLPSDAFFGTLDGWDTPDTLVHSAFMRYGDSMAAAEALQTDSIVLDMDSLTLLARSGDTEAQRQLDIRHSIEGDINGAWSNDALMVRDDSMRTRIINIKARFALSDSAKAELGRLGKP